MSKSLTRTTLICISLLPSLLGCGQSKSEFRPLANGFGYVIVRGGIDVAPGKELHYRGPDGHDVLIWDNVSSHVMVTNDMAVFAGERLAPEGGHLQTRLFAVRAPGPAIDITVPVLKVGARASQVNLTGGYPEIAGLADFITKSNEMVAVYQVPGANVYANLTWDEVAELLRQ